MSGAVQDTNNLQNQDEIAFFSSPIHSLGHALKGKPAGSLYMNENAVRARAGLLNATAWTVLVLVLTLPNAGFVLYTIAPIALWDMCAAATCGLTPFSPYGVAGTLLTMHLKPIWKPAEPKRFAWILGALMVAACVSLGSQSVKVGVIAVACSCIVLTWLEAVLGFCLGCWLWNNYVASALGMDACQECAMDFADTKHYEGVSATDRVDDGSATEAVTKAITDNHVVVFSKTVCPHCKRAKAKLDELGVAYHVMEIDSLPAPQPQEIASALIQMTGRKTVPNVFVGGKSIGGADETIKMANSGDLLKLLSECGAAVTRTGEAKGDIEMSNV